MDGGGLRVEGVDRVGKVGVLREFDDEVPGKAVAVDEGPAEHASHRKDGDALYREGSSKIDGEL